MLLHQHVACIGRQSCKLYTRSARQPLVQCSNPLSQVQDKASYNDILFNHEPTLPVACLQRVSFQSPQPSSLLSSSLKSQNVPAPSLEGSSAHPQVPPGSTTTQRYQLKATSRALLERRKAENGARGAAGAQAVDKIKPVTQDTPNVSDTSLSMANQTFFRFWHDEKRFKGTGADSLVQRALVAAGGRRTGGHLKSDPTHGPLGWQRMGSWDVLWSPASTALQAASQGLQRRQLVCAVPGSQSLTRKRRLPETLRQAYGPEGASSITPLTFQLPAQLAEWRAWMAAHPCRPGQPQRLWMLKTSQHLGKGLQLVPQDLALDAVLRRQARVLAHARKRRPHHHQTPQLQQQSTPSKGDGNEVSEGPRWPTGRRPDPNQPRPFVVAQLYVADPLLIRGRKFGIRLWAVVIGANPMRAYLHKNGLVLFATDVYDAAAAAAAAVERYGEGLTSEDSSMASGALSPSAGDGEEEGVGEAETEAFVDADGNDVTGATPAAEVGTGTVPTSSSSKMTPVTTTPATTTTTTRTTVQAPTSNTPLGHVTNYAQNVDGEVWSLKQLSEHLGPEKFSQLYRRILRSTALTAAAALPHVRTETKRVQLPASSEGGGCFELLGLDFLVDEQLRPWLLEVNATPSLAVQHSDPRVEQLIRQQKEGMVADMVSLLQLERRYGRDIVREPLLHRDNTQHTSSTGSKSQSQSQETKETARGNTSGSEGEGGSGSRGEGGNKEEQEKEGLRALLQAIYSEVFYNPSLLEVMESVEAELAAKGSFLPLMPLFPPLPQLHTVEASSPGDSRTTDGINTNTPGGGQLRSDSESSHRRQVLEHAEPRAAAATDIEESAYLLDLAKLPAGCGGGLRWSTADTLVRSWCRDRNRLCNAASKKGSRSDVSRGGDPSGGGERRGAAVARVRAASGGREVDQQ